MGTPDARKSDIHATLPNAAPQDALLGGAAGVFRPATHKLKEAIYFHKIANANVCLPDSQFLINNSERAPRPGPLWGGCCRRNRQLCRQYRDAKATAVQRPHGCALTATPAYASFL